MYMCVGKTWERNSRERDLSSTFFRQRLNLGLRADCDNSACSHSHRLSMWMGLVEREELADEYGIGPGCLRLARNQYRSDQKSQKYRATDPSNRKARRCLAAFLGRMLQKVVG